MFSASRGRNITGIPITKISIPSSSKASSPLSISLPPQASLGQHQHPQKSTLSLSLSRGNLQHSWNLRSCSQSNTPVPSLPPPHMIHQGTLLPQQRFNSNFIPINQSALHFPAPQRPKKITFQLLNKQKSHLLPLRHSFQRTLSFPVVSQPPQSLSSLQYFLPMSLRSCSSLLTRQCHVSTAQVLASVGYLWSTVSDICEGPLTLSRVHSILHRNFFQRIPSFPASTQQMRSRSARSAAGAPLGIRSARSTAAAAAVGGEGETQKEGPWLLVGLGNPGSKYDGTRHNVGFDIIDELAAAEGISLSTMQCKAIVGKGRICGVPVLLAKPQTFMNLSGESVAPLVKFYKIPLARVLVVYDDLDLDIASMKLLAKGGHGGHNGMRSIIDRFGGDKNFPRLRFGIGRPSGRLDTATFVLQRFDKQDKDEVDIAIARALDGVRLIMDQGIDRTVSQWNQSKKTTAVKV